MNWLTVRTKIRVPLFRFGSTGKSVLGGAASLHPPPVRLTAHQETTVYRESVHPVRGVFGGVRSIPWASRRAFGEGSRVVSLLTAAEQCDDGPLTPERGTLARCCALSAVAFISAPAVQL